MHHEVFGEIGFDADQLAWLGRIHLPEFAKYGQRDEPLSMEEPDEDFRKGVFPLFIEVDPRLEGSSSAPPSPTAQQVNTARFLRENEPAVCSAVIGELLALQRGHGFWGWLRRKLGFERQTLLEMHSAVRCWRVEFSYLFVGDHAYVGFCFHVEWAIEPAVVYHPTQGAHWGDWSAIDCIEEADNL